MSEELAHTGGRGLDLTWCMLTATGLTVKTEPTFDEWQALGETLTTLERGVAWIVGDWMNTGEAVFKEQAAQIISHEDWTPETVRVYRWVSEKVPPTNRRGDLTFNHHQVVAALPPSEQRAWLAKAAGENGGEPWSSQRLKLEIAAVSDPSKSEMEYCLVIAFDQPSDRDIVGQEHERVGRRIRKFEQTHKIKTVEL